MSEPHRPAHVLATLAVAAAGALLFRVLGLPLPFLLGAVCATTLAGLAGLPVTLPSALRTLVMAILGTVIGTAFDPGRLHGLARFGASLAGLVVAVAATAAAGWLYLRRVGGLCGRDAFFAAMPGGFGEMVLLADRVGADVGRVALIHAVRVWIIVTTAPFAVTALGGHTAPPPLWNGIAAGDLLRLAAAALLGAGLARRLRLPAWALTGPLAAGALLHLSGVVTARPPRLLVAGAQVVIGAMVGTRLRGLDGRDLPRLVATAAGLTLLMFALAALFALLAHLVTGIALPALLVAYVPGGVVEMGVVALALGLDPAFVATHHLLRILLLVGSAPILFALWRRVRARG